ncbi:MAG: hypothetical protein BJ554DRAFT_4365 [Olpidium bornovanus]|uniref:Uncharacterized protein n=1 Tax=Olpidium bornovanus TaxID=278681 RepID=A0A8H7ZMS0_9FUNG|nr:MAG: hypothetical protein BJ554DRAFT_4365 [Olpidium bornovanus]
MLIALLPRSPLLRPLFDTVALHQLPHRSLLGAMTGPAKVSAGSAPDVRHRKIHASPSPEHSNQKTNAFALTLRPSAFGPRSTPVKSSAHTFDVETDHGSLKWLLGMQKGDLACWAMRLSDFDLTIKPKPGRINDINGTSRRFPVTDADPAWSPDDIPQYTDLVNARSTATLLPAAQRMHLCISTTEAAYAQVSLQSVDFPAMETNILNTVVFAAEVAWPDRAPPEPLAESLLTTSLRPNYRRAASRPGYPCSLHFPTERDPDTAATNQSHEAPHDGKWWQTWQWRQTASASSPHPTSYPANRCKKPAGPLAVVLRSTPGWAPWQKQEYIRGCEIHQRFERAPRPWLRPLHPITEEEPFCAVAIDLITDLPEAADSSARHIAVFTDMFTKWPEAAPLTGNSAIDVADAFFLLSAIPFVISFRSLHQSVPRRRVSGLFFFFLGFLPPPPPTSPLTLALSHSLSVPIFRQLCFSSDILSVFLSFCSFPSKRKVLTGQKQQGPRGGGGDYACRERR